MPFKNDLVSLIDDGHRSKSFSELAASPLGVLAGLTRTQGARAMEALEARSIADVAASRYVLWSQSITQLAAYEKDKVDAFNPSLGAILDAKAEKRRLKEIAAMSPAVFTGLSDRDAKGLEEALGIRTVEDLATNRIILLAQVIAHLAKYERTGTAKRAA